MISLIPYIFYLKKRLYCFHRSAKTDCTPNFFYTMQKHWSTEKTAPINTQYTVVQSHDNTIRLIKSEKQHYSPSGIEYSLFVKTWVPFTQEYRYLVSTLVNIGSCSMVLVKNISQFLSMYFFTISLLLYIEQTQISFNQRSLRFLSLSLLLLLQFSLIRIWPIGLRKQMRGSM